jgi:hypothetical protein
MQIKTPCKYPKDLSLDVILPLFVNKCQKGKRKHTKIYSSGVSSESELKPLDESESEERGMVEAEAGVAAWALEGLVR